MSGNADVAKVFDVVGSGGGGLCKGSEVGGGVGEEFSKLVAGDGEHGGILKRMEVEVGCVVREVGMVGVEI